MRRTSVIGQALLLLSVATACLYGQIGTDESQPMAGGTSREVPLYVTGQKVFAIPFAVDPRITQPVEVHLYVSLDRGASWRLEARQLPGARQFTFRSQGDGEYWFASRTLDAGSRQQSNQLRPELRVAVDTQQPQLEFTARPGQNGDVITNWRTSDPSLVPSSMRIEYQEGIGQAWKPVATNAPDESVPQTSYYGELSWRPETQSATINIRAEISDRAGNRAVVNRRLLLPTATNAPGASETAANTRAEPFARTRQPSEGAVPWPSDNGPGTVARPPAVHSFAAAGQETMTHSHPTSPFPVSSQGANAPERADAPEPPRNSLPPYTNSLPDTPQQDPLPQQASTAPVGPELAGPSWTESEPTGPAELDRSSELADTFPASTRSSVPDLPLGERPQMTNATGFQLDYDVDAVGTAEVAEVQLWATADAGQTWRLWGIDEDMQSPFDVVVREEGIFGFQVVIVCRNGLSGRRPQTGDLADVWVGVDTTAPAAQLVSATYGTGAQIGKLVIRWNATDPALDSRPVSLYFSESPDGPWSVIASALPNNGEFSWPADPQLPTQVYLKLEVRDEAGNAGVDQLAEPIRLDGLAPKARIRGIKPMRDLDREAFRQPRRG